MLRADLPCVRPRYTSSGLSPPAWIFSPCHLDPPPRGGTPYVRRTARIQTGHAAGTTYSSARSRPSAPALAFPSPARCRPPAASLRTPGWPESQNTAPSGKTSPGCAVSVAPQFHAASAFPSAAHPYCGRGSGSSAWHRPHSVPAGSPLLAAFSGNGPGISRCFCSLPSFLTCTHASNRRPRSVSGCATVIRW